MYTSITEWSLLRRSGVGAPHQFTGTQRRTKWRITSTACSREDLTCMATHESIGGHREGGGAIQLRGRKPSFKAAQPHFPCAPSLGLPGLAAMSAAHNYARCPSEDSSLLRCSCSCFRRKAFSTSRRRSDKAVRTFSAFSTSPLTRMNICSILVCDTV